MKIIRYFLFVLSSLGWANIIFAENSYEPTIENTVDQGMKSGMRENKEEPDSDQSDSPMKIAAPEAEDWKMSIENGEIVIRANSETKGSVSGGPIKGDPVTLKYITFSVNEEKKSIDTKVIHLSEHPCGGALHVPVCEVIIKLSIDASGTVDNPDFEEYIKKMHKAAESESSVDILSGKAISGYDSYHNANLNYTCCVIMCQGSAKEELDGCGYQCDFPEIKDAIYMSQRQSADISNTIASSKEFWREVNVPPVQCSGTIRRKGIELHPVQ